MTCERCRERSAHPCYRTLCEDCWIDNHLAQGQFYGKDAGRMVTAGQFRSVGAHRTDLNRVPLFRAGVSARASWNY